MYWGEIYTELDPSLRCVRSRVCSYIRGNVYLRWAIESTTFEQVRSLRRF